MNMYIILSILLCTYVSGTNNHNQSRYMVCPGMSRYFLSGSNPISWGTKSTFSGLAIVIFELRSGGKRAVARNFLDSIPSMKTINVIQYTTILQYIYICIKTTLHEETGTSLTGNSMFLGFGSCLSEGFPFPRSHGFNVGHVQAKTLGNIQLPKPKDIWDMYVYVRLCTYSMEMS